MSEPLRILHLEDDPDYSELVKGLLQREGLQFDLARVETEAEFTKALEKDGFDVVLADYSLPTWTGLDALAVARQQCPDTPFILVSGTIGEQAAIESLKSGATDYVLKQWPERLVPAVSRAVQESREREQRKGAAGQLHLLETALNFTANAIVITDRAGTITWANPAFSEMTGFSMAEARGRKTNLIKSGQHDQAFYRSLWETILAGQVWRGEMVNRRKDGRLYTVESTITPVCNEQGEITHFVAIKKDITERKLAEAALAQSEERFRALFENAPDGIYLCDFEGRFVDGNKAAENLIGYKKAELIGKSFLTLNLLSETDLLKAATELARNAQGEATGPDEYVLLRKDGARLPVEIRTFPVRIQGQGLMLGVARDVSERKKLEQGLADALQFNQTVIAASSLGLFVYRASGQCILANSAAAQIIGATEDQLRKQNFRQIESWQNSGLLDAACEALDGGKNTRREVRTRSSFGNEFWVECRLIPFSAAGEPHLLLILDDISGRKQLEAQLRQAQKMEAIGQLAGGVAHDFNNLLAVMRGNADLLLMDADQHSPETNECLKQIAAAAERAAGLTRQLLIFSRKQVMQPEPLGLNDVVKNLAKMLKRIIREDIRLDCRYAEPLPFIQADPGMIEQVLLNLVVNARDAMPRGGQLIIATEKVSLDGASTQTRPNARPGEFVCLQVSDTGSGILPEHLDHIFEPFFTTKEAGKGTGLGLATVYGIVNQHQGWIDVSSQVGAGTTFAIFLPATTLPAQPSTAPAKPELRGGTETILLVEDDNSVRKITRQMLETLKYKVYEAACAREAVEIWTQHRDEIALLLTDIVMPDGVTGRDLAVQLRAKCPGLKLIFMSGYSTEIAGKDTQFFRQTKSYFLQKPCTFNLLLETVRRCLDEK